MAVFDRASITRAYDRWAPVYDLVFGKVFATGRAASIAAAESVGGRILEVGIGTGISLERYSRNNRITGIDISAPMLRKAQERVHALGLTQCRCAFGDGCGQARISDALLRRGGRRNT